MAIDGKSILELRQQNSHFQPLTPFFSSSSFTPLSSSPAPSVFQQKAAAPSIYSCENLAFFCKIEVKLEQSTGFPVKFRLGNVEYVDRLEGKRKWEISNAALKYDAMESRLSTNNTAGASLFYLPKVETCVRYIAVRDLR